MKKSRIFQVFALVLLVLIANTAYALLRETYIDYYYDDTFATWVGYYYIYCDATVDTNNVVGSWRIYDQYSCRTGARVVHRCQQTDGMGGWIDVGCPPWDP